MPNSKLEDQSDTSAESVVSTDHQLDILSSLLTNASRDESAPIVTAEDDRSNENQLVQVRLGIASSLFLALRAKHAPTADHSLRVALACSSWSILMGLRDSERDELEVAALLHDIGKLGIPDHILLKPGRLSAEETSEIRRHHTYANEILSACRGPANVVEIITLAPAWYDGSQPGSALCGDALPLAARLLSIVDAFDSMTSHQIHRSPMRRERALEELYQRAGTQFDATLVQRFDYYLRSNHDKLNQIVSRRWLEDLKHSDNDRFWSRNERTDVANHSLAGSLFHEQLLQNMCDGVVFVDRDLTILKWNQAIELLTGLPAHRAEHNTWDPSIVQMRDEFYKLLPTEQCPLIRAVRQGQATRQRLFVSDSKKDKVSIDALAAPVTGPDGTIFGGTLVLQDASSRVSLEERLESLHERASQDGLTGVANRAEFDRRHQQWASTHLAEGLPYSLIICDLDYFKRINDCYGHQAGDEALIVFASLLKKQCRSGDLVARYGGEEFVMLCADCALAQAFERAELIRQAWATQSHAYLDGKCLTASFGVTQQQVGDNAESMLRRADRALLQAKEEGRNTVVQIGSGDVSADASRRKGSLGWLWGWQDKPGQPLLRRLVITAVPLKLAAEKLRGFVHDYDAEIAETRDDFVTLEIASKSALLTRRATDRPTPLIVELRFREVQRHSEQGSGNGESQTVIDVTIRPKRQRDRRRDNADASARSLLGHLKSYLMAQDYLAPN